MAPARYRTSTPCEDAGELPVAERHVVADVADVAARPVGVVRHELGPGREALQGGGGGQPRLDRVAGLDPVDEQQADVGERVAEGAQLPVEHRGDLALGGEDAVVEAVVAVDDGGRALRGAPTRRAGRGGPRPRAPRRRGLASHWRVPARELALDVGLLAAEVAEPDGVDVDLVDRGQDVDERRRRPGGGPRVRGAAPASVSRATMPSTCSIT